MARADSEHAVRPLSLGAFYFEQASLEGRCKLGKMHSAVGFEPEASGRYPVFVYLTGTAMRYDGLEARTIVEEMARRGFVSVSIQYDNRAYAYCHGMRAKAQCLFGKAGTDSALSKLCARPNADCERGIVVAGFSQGASLSALARNYEPRIAGAWLLGHGSKAAHAIDVTPCQAASATAFEPAQTRSINGEADAFFGDNAEGVRKQLEIVTGRSCARAVDCLQADGSGWYIVRSAQLKDGTADHCFFFEGADGYCAKFKGLEANWLRGAEPWSLGPNLDWLAARVQRR